MINFNFASKTAASLELIKLEHAFFQDIDDGTLFSSCRPSSNETFLLKSNIYIETLRERFFSCKTAF